MIFIPKFLFIRLCLNSLENIYNTLLFLAIPSRECRSTPLAAEGFFLFRIGDKDWVGLAQLTSRSPLSADHHHLRGPENSSHSKPAGNCNFGSFLFSTSSKRTCMSRSLAASSNLAASNLPL